MRSAFGEAFGPAFLYTAADLDIHKEIAVSDQWNLKKSVKPCHHRLRICSVCNTDKRLKDQTDLPGLAACTEERVKPDFVGWTGIGPIAMLIENVLGLDVDAPAGKVTWDIRLTEEHGVRDLSVGGGKVDLCCAARGSSDETAAVSVRADGERELRVRCHDREVVSAVSGEVAIEV